MWFKDILSASAILLTFAAFIPYIRSIRNGTTKPHMFSWIIWGSTTFVVFLAQLSGGGGAGAWPIGVSGLITLYVAILAYQGKADVAVTRTDWWFLITAAISLPIWYFTSNPLWAVVILTTVDLLGFGPTIRKGYLSPYEEDLKFFALMVMRNLVAIAALQHYSVTTVLFPTLTAIAAGLFIPMVLLRRKLQIKQCQTPTIRPE